MNDTMYHLIKLSCLIESLSFWRETKMTEYTNC